MGWTRKSAGVTVLLAMEEHRKQVGARVLRLREARHWNQEDLAHHAKLSVKTISRVENGSKDSRRDTIRKIAKALDVTEQDLIGMPPTPLNLGQGAHDDDRNELLRQLVERQEAVEAALAELAEHVAAALPQAAPRRRRASGS